MLVFLLLLFIHSFIIFCLFIYLFIYFFKQLSHCNILLGLLQLVLIVKRFGSL